jgi:hypothetical protein
LFFSLALATRPLSIHIPLLYHETGFASIVKYIIFEIIFL